MNVHLPFDASPRDSRVTLRNAQPYVGSYRFVIPGNRDMDVSSDMEVSLMLDLSVDGTRTMALEEPSSIRVSDKKFAVKRNRSNTGHVQQKKVSLPL